MKKMLFAACLVALSATVSLKADIIGWNCDDDGDGAIVMDTPGFSYDDVLDEYELSMDGVQYDSPAHVEGNFTTDTEVDPKVWVIETVDNQTGFAWTGYQITIGMTKDFDITSVIAPISWTYTVTQPLVAGGQILPNDNGIGWVGIINYSVGAGDPIAVGDSGDFGFKIEFVGSVDFCTEQIPIPEPATLALLGIGVICFRRKK